MNDFGVALRWEGVQVCDAGTVEKRQPWCEQGRKALWVSQPSQLARSIEILGDKVSVQRPLKASVNIYSLLVTGPLGFPLWVGNKQDTQKERKKSQDQPLSLWILVPSVLESRYLFKHLLKLQKHSRT